MPSHDSKHQTSRASSKCKHDIIFNPCSCMQRLDFSLLFVGKISVGLWIVLTNALSLTASEMTFPSNLAADLCTFSYMIIGYEWKLRLAKNCN